MKKNFLNRMMKATLVVGISSVLGSCGGYIGYDDGIYGESTPRYTSREPRYERPTHETQGSYKAYLQQKVNGYSDFQGNMQQPSYTPLTDVNNYRTPSDNQQPTYNSYAGWGDNSKETSVTVYNNYGGFGGFYDPYYNWGYRHSYYWGSGAWFPYGSYFGYDYYRPYRSGWSISIGSYPYWGGYYGYYGSYYSPYYYGYTYPYYYGYRDNYYYGRDYGRRSYDNRVYSQTRGVRGDSARYENYNRQNTSRGTYNSPYSTNRNDNYSRSYHDSNRSTTPSSSPYYRSDRSDNSSRSYNSGGSSGSGSGSSGSSGAGTTRRNY